MLLVKIDIKKIILQDYNAKGNVIIALFIGLTCETTVGTKATLPCLRWYWSLSETQAKCVY